MLVIVDHKHSSHCTRGLPDWGRLMHYLPSRPMGDCWIFNGSVTGGGYGVLSVRRGGRPVQVRAHRLSYELHVGEIPDGLTIDHVKARGCSSRLCCNPDHLEVVTSGENNLRGGSPWARNAQKDRCIRGHAFDVVRVVKGKQYRGCSQCTTFLRRRADGYTGLGSGRRGAIRDGSGKFARSSDDDL